MKQNRLMQWIEAAEARSVCLLAEEGGTSTWPKPRPTDLVLARLREQLCVGEVSRFAARFSRVRSAD